MERPEGIEPINIGLEDRDLYQSDKAAMLCHDLPIACALEEAGRQSCAHLTQRNFSTPTKEQMQ